MALIKKPESALGVDIDAGGIKLVELRKNKGRPQLWTYAVLDKNLDIKVKKPQEKTPEDILREKQMAAGNVKNKKNEVVVKKDDPRIAEYANLLKMAAEKAHVTAKRVTASLPVGHIFHAIVNLPLVSEKELEYHVQAKVKKMLPRPIEEMQVVHQVIPMTGKDKDKSIKTLVTAAPKDIVQFYTDIFQKAGLILTELETEAFALERSLVGIDKATVMVVDVGADRTNFFIMDQGFPVTHRSIQLGGDVLLSILQQRLGMEDNEIHTLAFDATKLPVEKIPVDAFARLTEPIIKEIQYSFDLFFHQTGNENKKPEKIILTGGASTFPVISKRIQESFPIKVFIGDPWARVVYQQGLKGLLDKLGPRMSVSIGLALRGML